MAKPGRPAFTPEQRAAAKLAARGKYKNVTLDADLVAMLNAKADALSARFGFRPTLSQTVRNLIKEKS